MVAAARVAAIAAAAENWCARYVIFPPRLCLKIHNDIINFHLINTLIIGVRACSERIIAGVLCRMCRVSPLHIWRVGYPMSLCWGNNIKISTTSKCPLNLR